MSIFCFFGKKPFFSSLKKSLVPLTFFLLAIASASAGTSLPALAAPVSSVSALAQAAAPTACAKVTSSFLKGTVFGEDNLDVNVSIGFDFVDSKNNSLNADPLKPYYGCKKTGGYSIKQTYLNHFVSPLGAKQSSLMKDAAQKDQGVSSRNWEVKSIPSTAVGAYIEVYARGYKGSPCRDKAGNYCFNPENHQKYGNINKHLVPLNTTLPIRLPKTCQYGGKTGSIKGSLDPNLKITSLHAWSEAKWNAYPFAQGWGTANITGASYEIPALASEQSYVLWASSARGTLKKFHVKVNPCQKTLLNF